MAAKFGMETTLETGPGFVPHDLPSAVQIIDAVGLPGFKLLVDTMHIVRGGASVADLAALDPGTVGYIQLSDAPLIATGTASYNEEAMFDRLTPGTGELPLVAILDALPRDLVIGLEVPNRADARAGQRPHERLGRTVDAARRLLAQLDGDD